MNKRKSESSYTILRHRYLGGIQVFRRYLGGKQDSGETEAVCLYQRQRKSLNLFSKVVLTVILQSTLPIYTVKWQALRGNICSGRGGKGLIYLFLKGSELTGGEIWISREIAKGHFLPRVVQQRVKGRIVNSLLGERVRERSLDINIKLVFLTQRKTRFSERQEDLRWRNTVFSRM